MIIKKQKKVEGIMELETHKKPTHPKYGLSNGYERFDFQLSPMYDPICWSHGVLYVL